MAKRAYGHPAKNKSTVVSKYPSSMGSHAIMIDKILTDQIIPSEKKNDEGKDRVICRDDIGPYITEERRTSDDIRTADMNRWCDVKSREAKIKRCLPEGIELSVPIDE